jgi:hypothetical protein
MGIIHRLVLLSGGFLFRHATRKPHGPALPTISVFEVIAPRLAPSASVDKYTEKKVEAYSVEEIRALNAASTDEELQIW